MSTSLFGSAVVIVTRDAWAIVNGFLIEAVVGSSGSSWCAVSVDTCGCESPKASAASPSRSTLERNVTSKEPVLAVAVWRTLDGDTFAEPSLLENGTSNLSPVQPT